MNGPELALRLSAGLLLILANGFFVAIEFALTRVRQYPRSEFDVPGLRWAWEMTQDLEIYRETGRVPRGRTEIFDFRDARGTKSHEPANGASAVSR